MASKLKVQDSAQSAYVPDKSVCKKYISRDVQGHKDFSLLGYALDNQINVLLTGDTGSGKQYFRKHTQHKTVCITTVSHAM